MVLVVVVCGQFSAWRFRLFLSRVLLVLVLVLVLVPVSAMRARIALPRHANLCGLSLSLSLVHGWGVGGS